MNYLSTVCLHSLLGPKFLISGDKVASLPPGTGRATFTREIYFLPSGDKEEGQSVLLALPVPQGAIIHTNEYATLAYFGLACPEP